MCQSEGDCLLLGSHHEMEATGEESAHFEKSVQVPSMERERVAASYSQKDAHFVTLIIDFEGPIARPRFAAATYEWLGGLSKYSLGVVWNKWPIVSSVVRMIIGRVIVQRCMMAHRIRRNETLEPSHMVRGLATILTNLVVKSVPQARFRWIPCVVLRFLLSKTTMSVKLVLHFCEARDEQVEFPEEEQLEQDLHAAEIMLRRVHANLGQPSKGLMLRLLHDAKALLEMLIAARNFHCPHCDLMARRTGAVRPVQVSRSKELGHTISIDACHWKRNRDGREAIIMNIIDEASGFHVALVLTEGEPSDLGNLTAMDYIEAVRMNWFRFARAPAVIRVDSEGAFKSHEFREWCAARGIEVQMAAGEARGQIGIVETHIRLLKNQLSLMRRLTSSSNTVWFPRWDDRPLTYTVRYSGGSELDVLEDSEKIDQVLSDDWISIHLTKQPLSVPTLGRLCVWPIVRDHVY